MRERDVQARVVGYARTHRVLARKLDFGQGWPDYMLLHRGRVLFVEFKRPGEKPTPLQVYVHDHLRQHDFQVELVDDAATGISLVDLFIQQGVDQPGNSVDSVAITEHVCK